MNKDLLLLIKKIKEVNSLEELQNVQEFSNAILRNQKREAILTLMSISEEMGKDEILNSIQDLSGYLTKIAEQKGE
ncbi:MAG: hypothetical protein ACRBFS_23390 [Aureispira sp.]